MLPLARAFLGLLIPALPRQSLRLVERHIVHAPVQEHPIPRMASTGIATPEGRAPSGSAPPIPQMASTGIATCLGAPLAPRADGSDPVNGLSRDCDRCLSVQASVIAPRPSNGLHRDCDPLPSSRLRAVGRPPLEWPEQGLRPEHRHPIDGHVVAPRPSNGLNGDCRFPNGRVFSEGEISRAYVTC